MSGRTGCGRVFAMMTGGGMEQSVIRDGEERLGLDPAQADDARLAFIGRIVSPWRRGDCPKNLREARARGGRFGIRVDAPIGRRCAALSRGTG